MLAFDQIILGNTIEAWLVFGGVVLGSYFGLVLVKRLLVSKLKWLADRTDNNLDDFVYSLVKSTRQFFIFSVSLIVGSYFLDVEEGHLKVFRSSLFAIAMFQVWFWGKESINFFLAKAFLKDAHLSESSDAIRSTVPALEFAGKLILFSILVILALDNFGVDVTALMASLGVGGIAVALAVQNILGDLFASLSIVLDKPFVVGDFIVVGDLSGTVQKVGLKTTRITSLTGEQLIFSNSDLLSSRVRNFKRMQKRRILFSFGLVYQTPAERLRKVPQIVRQIIDAAPRAEFDRAHFKEFGDSSLNFEVVYYVEVPDYNVYMDVQEGINLALFEQFEKDGFDFAYPTQTLFVEKTEPSKEGDHE